MRNKTLFSLAAILICLFSGCNFNGDKNNTEVDNTCGISFAGKNFSRTSFVDVIPSGQTAVIPDGKNCTAIGDVFLESRTITLNSFSMCQYEVTKELFMAVMGFDPFTDSENCIEGETQNLRPISGISWNDAVIFCNKLSTICGYEPVYTLSDIVTKNKGQGTQYTYSMTVKWDFSKNGFRLPTEAEWEYAARGAGKTAEDWKYKFSGGDISKKVAWTNMNSSGYSDDDETLRTHEVGLKKPNALGLYDMSGNVSEWTNDWYRSVTENNDTSHGNAVKDSGAVTDPCLLKGKYDNHSIRGGAYNQATGYALNNQRYSTGSYACFPYSGDTYEGFRLVRRK